MEDKGEQTLKSFLLRCKTGLWRKRICLVDKLPSLQKEKSSTFTTVTCYVIIWGACISLHVLKSSFCWLWFAKWQVTRQQHISDCAFVRSSDRFQKRFHVETSIWSWFVRSRTICPVYLSHAVSTNPKKNETGNVISTCWFWVMLFKVIEWREKDEDRFSRDMSLYCILVVTCWSWQLVWATHTSASIHMEPETGARGYSLSSPQHPGQRKKTEKHLDLYTGNAHKVKMH